MTDDEKMMDAEEAKEARPKRPPQKKPVHRHTAECGHDSPKKRKDPWFQKPLVVFIVGFLIGVAFIGIGAGIDDGPFEDMFEDEEEEGLFFGYQKDFDIDSRTFRSNGSNKYFILEPGYRQTLEGDDDGVTLKLQITVLNETYMVGGIETRVYEEREWENDKLVEVSRNWLAIDVETNSVFYFGEEVDDYKDGQVISHEGEWEHGVNGATGGLMMPGLITLGAAYYQEVAPGVAMDRGINAKVGFSYTVPAGTYTDCLKVKESNAVDDPDEFEYKWYAPGVGLIQDEEAKLISAGYVTL